MCEGSASVITQMGNRPKKQVQNVLLSGVHDETEC